MSTAKEASKEQSPKNGTAAARLISEALTQAAIPHAVVGGLAVFANVWEARNEIAHTRNDVDLLLNRDDIGKAKTIIGGLGYKFELLSKLLRNRMPNHWHYVRAIVAGEKFAPSSFDEAPALSEVTTFRSVLGFQCLRAAPLLQMKLSAYRHIDKVDVQDMLDAKLITPKVARSLPGDLCLRLQHMKEVTKEERRR
ncbi:MAG: hypothetical protein ABSE73_01030 [Planctomycetota bacterium]